MPPHVLTFLFLHYKYAERKRCWHTQATGEGGEKGTEREGRHCSRQSADVPDLRVPGQTFWELQRAKK